jgi:microcystin-dependent protein
VSDTHKRVASVTPVSDGSATVGDLLAGATVIPVGYSDDFEGGTHVLIASQVYTYSAVDDGEVSGQPSITLNTGLAANVDDDTAVELWNANDGTVVMEWKAEVTDDIDGSAGIATLLHTLIPLLPEGQPLAEGDSVVVREEDDGSWTIIDVVGKTPTVSLAYSDPATLDEAIPPAPPAVSPTVTAIGLLESFILRCESFATGDKVAFQVSSDGGSTWADLPGMPVRTQIVTAKTLPDDSPFVVGTDYLFRTIASNAAGAAAASAATPAVQLNTAAAAVVASQVVTDQIIAGWALVGELSIAGNNFRLFPPGTDPDYPAGGLLIRLTGDGEIYLPADAAATARMVGVNDIDVENLDVTNLDIQGSSHLGGDISVGATITDPTSAPIVTSTYDSVYTDVNSNPRGLCRDVAGTGWITTEDNRLIALDAAGNITAQVTVSGMIASGGVTKVGSDYYVLRQLEGSGWRVSKFNSSLALQSTWNPSSNDFQGDSPAIGTDGTNVIVASFHNVPAAEIVRYTTAGAFVDAIVPNTSIDSYGGVFVGAADFGGTRWVLHPDDADVLVYNGSAVLQSGDAWPRPAGHKVRGLWWDGTNFWVINGTGLIRKLEGAATTATHYWSYTYVDSDTHATGPSPQRTWPRVKRSKVMVTCPAAPQTSAVGTHVANRIQIYAASTVGGTKFPQGAALAVGATASAYATVGATGTPPGVNNWNFVTIPGNIHSETVRSDGEPKFEVDGNGQGRFDGLIGPGSIMMYGGAVAPPGWLLCDGAAVARTGTSGYPDLFAAIGETFGSGNGSTTFNVPDLRGRFPIGVNPAATTHAKTLGLTETGNNTGDTAANREGRLNHEHAHQPGTLGVPDHGTQTNTTTGGTATRVHAPAHGSLTGSTSTKGLNDSSTQNHAFLALNFIIKV